MKLQWILTFLAVAQPVLCEGKTISQKELDKPESQRVQERLSQMSEQDMQKRLSEIQESLATLQSQRKDPAARAEAKIKIKALAAERVALRSDLEHCNDIDKWQIDTLQRFEGATDIPQVRATIMSLMATADMRYRHAVNRPETHRRLTSMLQKEFAYPAGKKTTDQDTIQTATQAIYWLAKTDGPFDFEFFLSALMNTRNKRDPTFSIRQSILHVLQPHVSMVATNLAWQNQLLVALAQSREDMLTNPDAGALIRGPLSWLINEVVTVSNLVDVLETVGDGSMAPEILMCLLEWDYRLLANSASVSNEVLRERHARAVGELFWHANKQVRDRSRVLLTTYDPLLALSAIADRLQSKKTVLPEDFTLFASILSVADKALASDAERVQRQYESSRDKGATALFVQRWSDADLPVRETVCNLLLESDPKLLASHLIANTPAEVPRANSEQAIQYIRYLGALRRHLANETKQAGQLVRSLQAWLSHRELLVRQQAVAQLIEEPPQVLLVGLKPIVQDFSSESTKQAEFLLSIWLATLERAEQIAEAVDDKQTSATVAEQLCKVLGVHPYDIVLRALMRPEFELRCLCCAFLKERDPEGMIRNLLARVEAKPAEQVEIDDVAYLGNAAATVWTRLSDATRQKILAWHRNGLNNAEEDKVLLHGSLLIQLGGMGNNITKDAPKIISEIWRIINENN